MSIPTLDCGWVSWGVDRHRPDEQHHWARYDLAGKRLEHSDVGKAGILGLGSRDYSWPLLGD